MTDKDALYLYRLTQAEETLAEAEKMIMENFGPRTIVNRAYYTMFYSLLALFIKTGINPATSKHRGVISLFDKEFVKTGKIDKYYSSILHSSFDNRLEGDYKEFTDLSIGDASEAVKHAKEFMNEIKRMLG
jgi:uncharacterized protein (UPF0332 family)